MTTLILAQKRITALVLPTFNFGEVSSRFVYFNRQGILSASFLAILGIGICGYLIALFFSFSLGFYVQDSVLEQGALYESIQEKELLLQEKINSLATGQNPILESMEKVSAIKYLTEKSVAWHQ